MLRNVVLHISNEQPLLADLFELPSPSDITLRLTYLRSPDGKRLVFVDGMMSVFLFPYHRVSFVEIPPQALAGAELADGAPVPENALVPVGAAANGPGPAEDD